MTEWIRKGSVYLQRTAPLAGQGWRQSQGKTCPIAVLAALPQFQYRFHRFYKPPLALAVHPIHISHPSPG